MRHNKIIAVLITISMLLTCATSPVSAADSELTKTYADDNFAEGTDGWIVGESEEGYSAQVSVVEDSGAKDRKALKITFPKKSTTSAKSGRNNLTTYGNVTKQGIGNGTEFSTDKELTIKTRIKKTDPAMYFDIRGNRPNTSKQPMNDWNWAHNYYVLLIQNAADGGVATLTDGVQDVGDYNGAGYYGYRANTVGSSTKVDLTGKWVEYTITFKPADQKFYVTTTYTDTDGTEKPLQSNQVGYMRAAKPELLLYYGDEDGYPDGVDDYPFNKDIKQYFPGLESLTFTSRIAGDIYVDYVKVYGKRDIVTVSDAVLDKTYVRATDEIKLTFTSDGTIHYIPDGAVYIDGVEADVTYDKTSKTVTLKPKSELVPGASYNVKVKADLFAAEGVTYNSSTELGFEVSNVSVNNLVASGRVIPGNVITSSYIYSSPKPEGTHQYRWQVSENGTDGWQYIDGATSKDFTVTDAEYGKYIRFEMIPYGLDEEGNNTYYGFETYSNAVIPEKAPVIENLRLSATTLFINSYLSASYDYTDENGDKEGETEVIWYSADSAGAPAGDWTEVGRGLNYKITDADDGKYIKCTVIPKNNALHESTGVEYYSEAAGPVADLISSTNMISNASFEEGFTDDFSWASSAGWEGVEVVTKDAHTGTHSLHLPPRKSVNDSWGANITITTGKTYIDGSWVKKTSTKAQDVVGMWPYPWNGLQRLDTQGQYSVTANDRWQLGVCTYTATKSVTTRVGMCTFEAISTGDVYIDDVYFGELLIGDIDTYNVEPITIPTSGTTSVAVTSGKVLNQLGTQHGLWNEKINISIPEAAGITIDGNNIVVSDAAIAGTYPVEISVTPSYSGASQSIFRKFANIELLSNGNEVPRALNVDATGTVVTGSTLTGTYDFHQINGKADVSELKWLYSDTENGTYAPIPNATGLTYTVEEAYADKYIKFSVTPKAEGGMTGTEVVSDVLLNPVAPTASNVSVSGDFKVGGVLKGTYTYNDKNKGDTEDTSTYQWYKAETENGTLTPISGANSDTFTITSDLVDKYISFGVTPVSDTEPKTGVEVKSRVYIAAAAPEIRDLIINQDGYRLTGSYTFYHPYNAREQGTIYQWLIDGSVVSNEVEYVVDFTGAKNITLNVTPVADTNPSTGTTVSVTISVQGKSESSGIIIPSSGTSGGGGGGGYSSGGGITGGGSSSGITNINNKDYLEPYVTVTPEEQNPSKPVNDIENHWGKEYILNMVDRGVMEADSNGDYQPDSLATREDMLTYLFKVLKLEPTEYSGMFIDVPEGDFAKMLQTMVDNGTIIGDGNAFRPKDTISREEMCKILYISLNNAGKLEKFDDTLIGDFADYDNISDWAKEYVNSIFGLKIMIGVSDSEFDAKGKVTKAQAATMLTRIMSLIEE